MGREQNLIVFHPLLLTHPVGYLLLIFLSNKFVFLYFLFKHRRKGKKNYRNDKGIGRKSSQSNLLTNCFAPEIDFGIKM